jgi:hypothetical protein
MLITTVIATVTIITLTEDLLQEDKTGHTTRAQGNSLFGHILGYLDLITPGRQNCCHNSL